VFATLHAKKARPELDVTIAVKGRLGTCGSTRMVQGGYNVALAPEVQSSATSWTRSRAAGWLNDQELAWLLVRDGSVHDKRQAGRAVEFTVGRLEFDS
jgi:fumarate reductase flavoprotein subunit